MNHSTINIATTNRNVIDPRRDDRATSVPPAVARAGRVPSTSKETHMLLYEELARFRIRELQQTGAEQRNVRRARAARRWERLAGWATARSRRYRG